jgi:THO complex subunit 6
MFYLIFFNCRDSVDKADVNSLAMMENQELLVAGCGDNNVYTFDVSEGRLVQTFEGHQDYIHNVSTL